jgi:hypothetical protein
VQDRGHADIAPEMAEIAAEAGEREGRGLKEEPVDEAGVALGERVERVGQGEDDGDVVDWEQLTLPGGEPALGGHPLAFRAVAVTA